jgi:CRISPR-associated protein Cas1
MALRAAVARAICGAGLHPSIGLHHRNRYNPFCLADDLVEPLRPAVDERVRKLWQDGVRQVDRPSKGVLLGVLTAEVITHGQRGPLMVALGRMMSSLVRCFAGEERVLEIPRPCI